MTVIMSSAMLLVIIVPITFLVVSLTIYLRNLVRRGSSGNDQILVFRPLFNIFIPIKFYDGPLEEN